MVGEFEKVHTHYHDPDARGDESILPQNFQRRILKFFNHDLSALAMPATGTAPLLPPVLFIFLGMPF